MAFFSLNYQKLITKKLNFIISASLIHASNGHVQVPNAGMNIVTGDIGLKYYFNENIQKEKITNNYKNKKNNKYFNLNFKIGIGVHEFAQTIGPVGTPKHNIYTGAIFLSKRLGLVNKIYFGFNGKYYTDFYNFIDTANYYVDNYHLKSSIFTSFVGIEFIIGQFALFGQAGYNFYTPLRKKRLYKNIENIKFFHISELYISTRGGLKYYLLDVNKYKHNNIFIAVAIKANFGQADFPEISIGYVF